MAIYGWIWTSGVLSANLGHGDANITNAVTKVLHAPLHHSYVYPTKQRLDILESLHNLTNFEHVVLLITGSEAIEAAIKITMLNGKPKNKKVIVGFENGFSLSAVLMPKKSGDVLNPGEISSTHFGNPITIATAIEVADRFQNGDILAQAVALPSFLKTEMG